MRRFSKGMAAPDVMMPREAGKFIVDHSKDVKICKEGVQKTAKLVSTETAALICEVSTEFAHHV